MTKRYIFMAYSVADIGGAELYCLGKKKWLEEHGWSVDILTAIPWCGSFKIQELNKFKYTNFLYLGFSPFVLRNRLFKKLLNDIVVILNIKNDDEIIIESHESYLSVWAELLAAKIGAKHIISLINENYGEAYNRMNDFYYYKWKKGELFGGRFAIHHVFDGKKYIEDEKIKWFKLNEDPVQNVQDSRINKIQKYDYNICYIGRIAKPYVPNVFEAVKNFSIKHKDEIVQFVIIGDISDRKKLVDTLTGITNLKLELVGDLVPIPKALFKKIDVVIAGSGSARASASEGVYTIAANPDDNMSNGVLGYDTLQTLIRDKNVEAKSFYEALEDVLVKRIYDNMEFKYPNAVSVDVCCAQNMQLINESGPANGYYDFSNYFNDNYSLKYIVKANLTYHFPNLARQFVRKKNKLRSLNLFK